MLKKIVVRLGVVTSVLSGMLIPSNANAQEFYESMEYGLQAGASTYFGDLNPNYGVGYIRPAVGAFMRYHINPYISVRGMLNYTQVGYDDQMSSNEFQKIRNLSFRSNVVELGVLGEFNFFWFSTGEEKHRFTPYVALGFSAFYYDPYREWEGKTYRLRPLGTEGQNLEQYSDRKYSSVGFAFPIGVGVKYWVSPGFNIGFELINRFTFTDYLDDVSQTYVGIDKFTNNPTNPSIPSILQDPSLTVDGIKLGREGKQRGDQGANDQFFMAQITLSFQLRTYKCPSHLRGVWEP